MYYVNCMQALHRIQHWILPHESNNQRAKVLHPTIMFFVLALYVLSQTLISNIPKLTPGILGYKANIPVAQVVELTNQKRTDNGLQSLAFNEKLAQAAQAKGADMLQKNYWAHISPDGTEPWAFFKSAGYSYKYAGENLARDFSNPSSAVDAWMASPSHRDNLLSPKYTEIGIAVVEGDLNGVDTTIIVQLFGVPSGSTSSIVDTSANTSPTTARSVQAQTNENIPSPSPVPSTKPTSSPSPILIGQTQEAGPSGQILINPHTARKDVTIIIISILLIIMIIDTAIVARKNIHRISSRTFAHLSFFGMILAIILIARAGQIL